MSLLTCILTKDIDINTSLLQWRDHWMQAIYYPYNHVTVAKGDQVKVVAKHDEYSLWFDILKNDW